MDTDESNALLDVPIVIPERAEGLREPKETEETAEVESNGCQSGIGVRPYYIDEGNWQAGKRDRNSSNARSLLSTQGRQRLTAYKWSPRLDDSVGARPNH